jgi:predicted O-linked N-acetylglucosamine transferase (SPINDLY family)
LALNPKQPGVIQHWVHIRQKACKWPVYKELPNISRNEMLMATSPLAMLAMTDDPVQQLLTAHAFVGQDVERQIDHEITNPERHRRCIGQEKTQACRAAAVRKQAMKSKRSLLILALVLAAGLAWREASLLRALGRYLRQVGAPYAQGYIADALARLTA